MKRIDMEVSQKITQTFNNNDPELWKNLESEFYNRLTELNLYRSRTDSLQAINDLINFVLVSGYPKGFYVDYGNPESKKLIDKLNKIGYGNFDESANRFLYNLINPIITTCDNLEELKESEQDLLIAIGLTNPDSSRISYDIATSEIRQRYNIDDLKRPGLRKTLILFYFSRMIEKNE